MPSQVLMYEKKARKSVTWSTRGQLRLPGVVGIRVSGMQCGTVEPRRWSLRRGHYLDTQD